DERQLLDYARDVQHQEIRDHRDHGCLPQVAFDGCRHVLYTVPRGAGVTRLELLVQVETVHDVRFADARPRGRHLAELIVERDQAELILEEDRGQADGGDGSRDGRRDGYAVDAAARGHRRVGDGHDRRIAVLL